MNVLADFHHPDLWWSFHILFKERLGWDLYRPIGMEWFDRGYHYINDEGRGVHTAEKLSRKLLVETVNRVPDEPGMYYGEETAMGCVDYPYFRAVTLEEARHIDFDILLCSTSCNEAPTVKMRNELWPEAKILRQVGNYMEKVNPKLCPNVLCSDLASYHACESENVMFYHPEFNTDLAKWTEPVGANVISSFIHHFHLDEKNNKFVQEVDDYLEGWEFRFYGEGSWDGKIWVKREEIDMIGKSKFIWQTKNWDGYGFNIHRAYACGRPVICWPSDYVGKTAEPLLSDDETCIFLEDDSKKSAEKILSWAGRDKHRKMCENAYMRFKEVVDFDKEFIEINEFLCNLV